MRLDELLDLLSMVARVRHAHVLEGALLRAKCDHKELLLFERHHCLLSLAAAISLVVAMAWRLRLLILKS